MVASKTFSLYQVIVFHVEQHGWADFIVTVRTGLESWPKHTLLLNPIVAETNLGISFYKHIQCKNIMNKIRITFKASQY